MRIIYTRLDAFRDRFASLVTSFRTDCERKCDLGIHGDRLVRQRFEELKASTSTPKLYTPFGENKKCSFIRNDSYKKGT